MYQKMFDEQGDLFLGLIVSPYYQPSDLPTAVNSMPLIRCFINYRERPEDKYVPFEVPINIVPQTRLNIKNLIKETIAIRENPWTLDKI